MKQPYAVNITPVLNGWKVQVGCEEIVIVGGYDELLKHLKEYYEDPLEVEKRYLKNTPHKWKERPRLIEETMTEDPPPRLNRT